MQVAAISERYERIRSHLDEKGRRLWCANEAISIGRGGITLVAHGTGVSRTTITEGVQELRGEKALWYGRVRREGGGRKKQIAKDPALVGDLERLVESSTRGDPENPLLWSSKSTGHIADALNRDGHRASDRLVARTLQQLGYSLQANRKVAEGGDHPDRDAQFTFINEKSKDFQRRHQPVVSVDTKKKELVGNFKNGGREYHQKGQSPKVNV